MIEPHVVTAFWAVAINCGTLESGNSLTMDVDTGRHSSRLQASSFNGCLWYQLGLELWREEDVAERT
jgi:hypothetical protein